MAYIVLANEVHMYLLYYGTQSGSTKIQIHSCALYSIYGIYALHSCALYSI